jgi:SWI/SNF-related matrix-associated actin-dependent regulator 1 of chromatin subfamily A
MLHFDKGRQSGSQKWIISSSDLRKLGIRSPQGFSFSFGTEDNYFYTTNEFAAFLFNRRYNASDEEVREYFSEKEKKDEYLYNLSFATTSEREFKCPEGLKYRPHQLAGIEYCQMTANTLIADEQRIGKTAIAIGVINNTDNVNKVLILCPKTAKLNWKKELETWLINKDFKIQVVSSKSEIDHSANIYIVNYDILHIQTELLNIPFDLAIPDECHIVSRMETRRAKFFSAVQAKKIVALSGTPLLNNPKDLLTICQWLDPTWKQFTFKNGSYINNQGISLELDEAQYLMRSSIMVRRLQSQVFDTEPIETRVIPIPANDSVRAVLDIERKKIGDYALARKMAGLYKIPYALNHIETYSSEGEKMVIFGYHHQVIERIKSSLGSRAVCIYGKTSTKDREEAKERFINDKSCQFLIGSIESAGMAIDLSVANHILFVEVDWKNWALSQAMERCSAKDQKHQVTVEYLCFENSVDHEMLTRVDKKNTTVDKGINLVY